MSFGFSVGDLATVINLIDNIASSLQNNGGAKSEYQELLRTLECLRNALDDLDSLQSSEADSNTIDAVVYAALSCRHILETFRESIRGYDRTLGVWAKGRPVKSIVDKLRWTFQQRHRPSPLLTTLDIHIDVINILLAKHGQEKLDRISSKVEAHQSRIQETLEDTRVKIGEIGDSVKAQALAVQSNTSVLGKLHQIISDELSGPWRSVANLVAKLW
jgi:hypothetical protein